MLTTKKLRKSLVFVIIVALLLGQSIISYAAPAENADADIAPLALDESKPTIYVDYLGVDEGAGPPSVPRPSPGFTEESLIDKSTEPNTAICPVFWVGVRVDNLRDVEFLKEEGLRNLEIAFDYNPEFVKPCDVLDSTVSSTAAVDKDKWMQLINDANFSDTGLTQDGKNDIWKSSDYKLTTYSAFEANPDTEPDREYEAPSGWKTQFVSIQKKDNDKTTNRFFGVDDISDHYLLKIPFRLVNAPDDGGKPLAFRLSLGPSSLVMTVGDSGYESYQWEKNTRMPDDSHNLKDTFQFAGQLNIFKADSDVDEMTEFAVSYPTADSTEENKTYEAAQLYSGDAQSAEQATKFLPGTYEYYITVPSHAKEVKLDMSSFETAPVVKRWDYDATGGTQPNIESVTAAEDTSIAGNWSAVVSLKGSGADYTDTISITINDGIEGVEPNEYKVHVKKEASEEPPTGEARIELAPGNSPYGLIERMGEKYYTGDGEPWSEEKIAKAKEEFDKGNKFADGYVPDGGDAGVTYTPKAWVGDSLAGKDDDISSPEINMDRNSTALFIYNRTAFADAGFVAYDSRGNKVEDEKVTRSIKVDVMPSASLSSLKDSAVPSDPEPIVINQTANNGLITDLSKLNIRPGVYTMTYSFTDPVKGTDVITIERKVVVVWQNGDADLSTIRNGTDADIIMDILAKRVDPYSGVNEITSYIFKFRILDVDNSTVFNATDSDVVMDILAKRAPAVIFYSSVQ